MKKCSQCKELKDESGFYKDRNSGDGFAYSCKSCAAQRSKNYREQNPEKHKEFYRKWLEKNYESVKESQKRHREKFRDQILKRRRERRKLRRDEINKRENERRKSPEFLAKAREWNRKYYKQTMKKQLPMRQAHKMIMYALKLGIMKRPTECENCGSIGKVEGHHDDYNKPLEVQWLCKGCHARHHNEIKD